MDEHFTWEKPNGARSSAGYRVKLADRHYVRYEEAGRHLLVWYENAILPLEAGIRTHVYLSTATEWIHEDGARSPLLPIERQLVGERMAAVFRFLYWQFAIE